MIGKNKTTLAENNKVLTPKEFLLDFKHETKKAQKRIWIQTMYFREGKVADEIVSVLRQASQRQVNTIVQVDWFHIMTILNKAPLTNLRYHFFSEEKLLLLSALKPLKVLKKNGVKILFTNKPSLAQWILPYKGRNHMKITIIDDVAYIGGVNIADSAFSYVDFMLKISDKKIVQVIANQYLKIHTNSLRDIKVNLDNNTVLLIESGKLKESKIMQFALDIVRRANENVYHVSQFIPDGRLLTSLFKQYQKGINIVAIYPKKNTFSYIFNIFNIINKFIMYLTKRVIPLNEFPDMVHAKLTIIDDNAVLFGSHNLSAKGIKMGTAEIALYSTNKELVHNLLDYYGKILKQSKRIN